MKRINQFMPEWQISGLNAVKRQTDTSLSEVLRKMVNHCLKPEVLNELFPAMSGRVDINK